MRRSELYIVEGDSAGGSAKAGRDSEFQAILPLRGKILNVERARLDKMLGNNEIKNLIVAMGTGIGDQFEISKLRYGHIIIMTDADVDGAHIRTLLLTFFYRHMPEVIEQGHLYIAQPPLYLLPVGRKKIYAYSDEERDAIIDRLIAERSGKKGSKTEKSDEAIAETVAAEALVTEESAEEAVAEDQITASDDLAEPGTEEESPVSEAERSRLKQAGITGNIQRYKGLGEMNAEQLWETTMNPENRILLQVTIDDAEKADAIFNKLMGEEVLLRKNFIQTHAREVVDIDI
jgi:DNA gyrase subunit B